MEVKWLYWILVGYLCGSVPFALLIGKLHGVDIRQVGSGNVGATNVGRAVGRRWGFACFVLDVLKGLVPVAVAGCLMGMTGRLDVHPSEAMCWLLVATAAMLGHVFPVWLKFRGGKGVATGLGALLGFWPILTLPTIAAAVTWVLMVLIWRYVSLASIIAALSLPMYLVIQAIVAERPLVKWWPLLTVAGAMAGLVILRHRGNITRLLTGTEPRIGQKRAAVNNTPQADV